MFNRRPLPQPFIALLLIFLFLLPLNFLGIFRPLRGKFENALIIPVQAKIFRWQRFLKKDLGGCALAGERTIAELKVQIASLTEENREQKRLLSSPLPRNWQFLTAKVIGLGDETLTIDQGRKEGVKEGMVVISGQTFLGKVVSLSEEMAQVRLPSFFEERLMVRIVAGKDSTGFPRARGLLVGRGQGKMRVEQILTSEEVSQGDLVITNLEGGDLLVGEVEEVMVVKGEVFKSAQVKRLFNPEELETVFLIKGKI